MFIMRILSGRQIYTYICHNEYFPLKIESEPELVLRILKKTKVLNKTLLRVCNSKILNQNVEIMNLITLLCYN